MEDELIEKVIRREIDLSFEYEEETNKPVKTPKGYNGYTYEYVLFLVRKIYLHENSNRNGK